jgi:hypothetical protein
MRSLQLAIVVSHLLALATSFGPCAITDQTNCFNNVGFECGEDQSGDEVTPGQDICCYDAYDSDGELVETGMVQCGDDGVYFALPCVKPLECHTDFSTCEHECQ